MPHLAVTSDRSPWISSHKDLQQLDVIHSENPVSFALPGLIKLNAVVYHKISFV
jgi:hypothetical protein